MKTYLATFENQDYEKLEVTFNVEKGQRFETRLHQVASFIKENYDLDKFNVNLVYLDDDCRIDATFKYGYESLNLNAFKFLTSDCNTLFLFPWADRGVSEKSLRLANSFWSIGC